mgnify:CR=1 FL=1
MNSLSLYSKLPIFLQNAACTYYGYREKKVRMGRAFDLHLKFLLSTEFSSIEEIEKYQNKKIASLVRYSYENVPFYKSLFDRVGIAPEDIQSRSDLKNLPILRKEDVFQFSEELRSTGPVGSAVRKSKTSGTSGTALSFFTTEDAVAFTWAVWWRHRSRFGFVPGDWHVNFTGRPAVPLGQARMPYWRIDWARKQIIISASHLVPGKIGSLTEYLNKKNIEIFTGYPSQIAQFCGLLESEGLALEKKPSFIFPGAENVQDFQQDVISRVTGAEITDQYGFSEGACNASRCEYGNYHEDWEYGVMDCEEGVENPDGSMTGKIIGTGFTNLAFPFIRYEVGDTATWAPEGYVCPCGRQSRVIWKIDGRSEDFILTPEGNRVMRLDYLFKDSKRIREAQVVQRELGAIAIRYVPREGFDSTDLDHIKKTVKGWISPLLQVTFERVTHIERSASGKFKPVVSELRGSEKK